MDFHCKLTQQNIKLKIKASTLAGERKGKERGGKKKKKK
jgi:hypothetical protein